MPYLLELTGEVGSNNFNAPKVRKALAENEGQPVNIMIDSFGGLLSEGLSISGALRDHGQVTVHLRGMIASAATIASMGAAHISMAPEALYLVHKASMTFLDWASRNADQLETFIEELQHTKDNLDAMDRAIAETYARRCKKPVADLLELMKGEKWLSAQETLEWGFIDEIQESNDKNSDSKPKAITAQMAGQITALGLPLPPVSIIEPQTSGLQKLLHNFIDPIVNAINSLKPQNQTQSEMPQESTSPTTANLEPQASSLEPSSTQQPSADAAALAAANEEIARLKAELAAKPGAVSATAQAQPVAPKANDDESPYARFLRTNQSAQALYNRIP